MASLGALLVEIYRTGPGGPGLLNPSQRELARATGSTR